MANEDKGKFLTVAEVAEIMRVSKMTVYRLVHSGELPAVREEEGHARLVAVYENGRARAGWRRRNWASNWEEIGVKDLRAWAVGQ